MTNREFIGNWRSIKFAMRAVLGRTASIVFIVFVAFSLAALAQKAPDKPPEKPELGPATKQTKQEMDAARTAQAQSGGTLVAAPVDPRTYEIGPEDILNIFVWREP